jgi:hypothetical protein
VYETDDSPIGRLKAVIAAVNEAANARFGHPLYADTDLTHAQSINVLRVPANNSMSTFQEQLRGLAILTVDHINGTMLNIANIASPETGGNLNRLPLLYAELSGTSINVAKEQMGGLFAIQSLRSTIGAHRTGAKGEQALTRAQIVATDRAGGFAQLVARAIAALESLERVLAMEPGSRPSQ